MPNRSAMRSYRCVAVSGSSGVDASGATVKRVGVTSNVEPELRSSTVDPSQVLAEDGDDLIVERNASLLIGGRRSRCRGFSTRRFRHPRG
jgi:hypothetical protein